MAASRRSAPSPRRNARGRRPALVRIRKRRIVSHAQRDRAERRLQSTDPRRSLYRANRRNRRAKVNRQLRRARLAATR